VRAFAVGFWLGILVTLALVAKASAAPLRVAVIDTGVDVMDERVRPLICQGHTPWDTALDRPVLRDEHGHGMHVAGLIARYAEGASFCFMFFKYFADSNSDAQNVRSFGAAIRRAVAERADIVNISGGGPQFSEDEYLAIRDAKRTRFIVAAGNEAQDLAKVPYYPASYDLPNVTVVGALDARCAGRYRESNYGKKVDTWQRGERVLSWAPGGRLAVMNGTSQATAIFTGKVVAGWLDSACR
jgi:major intracellular serine protease